MQQVVESGSARSIGEAGLGNLNAAGKTGTSDTQRDSWFAGFSGNQLGVVWVGRDDNKPTGLYGSTGALKVWIDLFKRLPAEPLVQPADGIEHVWIDSESGERSDAVCAEARELPFMTGYAPSERHGCALDRIRDWLGRGDN
jgi:penicillin-binding protein 1B